MANLANGMATPHPASPDFVDKIPADKRGYFHSIVGAAFVLLVTLGYLNDSNAAVIGGAALAAVDLALVLAYTRSAWRKALFPVLYGGGAILAMVGVFNEVEVAAIVGLVAAVLGTQVAAAKTPVQESIVA